MSIAGDFSPATIELLLYHYYSPERHPRAEQLNELIQRQIDRGLMRYCGGDRTHELTPMGTAYIELLLATPLPIQVYTDPRIRHRDQLLAPNVLLLREREQ